MNENIELLKKYNLWGSKTFDFGFIRNEYLPQHRKLLLKAEPENKL
jgi:hypothetical protein